MMNYESKRDPEVAEFMRLEGAYREFCRAAIASNAMEDPVRMTVKVPAKVKWLAEQMASRFRGVTLDELVSDALMDYLTKQED